MWTPCIFKRVTKTRQSKVLYGGFNSYFLTPGSSIPIGNRHPYSPSPYSKGAGGISTINDQKARPAEPKELVPEMKKRQDHRIPPPPPPKTNPSSPTATDHRHTPTQDHGSPKELEPPYTHIQLKLCRNGETNASYPASLHIKIVFYDN